MKCPECKSKLKKVEGAMQKVMSVQCTHCDYFKFDRESGEKVIREVKEKRISPLNIKQKVIKISHDRLGTYFNENVVRSLKLKGGEDIYVSVPDKRHIVITIKSQEE